MARGRDDEKENSGDTDGDDDSDSDSSSSSTAGSDTAASEASGSGSSGSSGSDSGRGSGGGDDDASKDGSNFEVSFWQSMKAVMPWTKEGEEASNRNIFASTWFYHVRTKSTPTVRLDGPYFCREQPRTYLKYVRSGWCVSNMSKIGTATVIYYQVHTQQYEYVV